VSFDFFKVNNLQMEVFHIDNTFVNKVHDPLTMEPSKLCKNGCTWISQNLDYKSQTIVES
jgi:hypothetical protein